MCDRARIPSHLFLFNLHAFSLSNLFFVFGYPSVLDLGSLLFLPFISASLSPIPEAARIMGQLKGAHVPEFPHTALTETGASTSPQGVSRCQL